MPIAYKITFGLDDIGKQVDTMTHLKSQNDLNSMKHFLSEEINYHILINAPGLLQYMIPKIMLLRHNLAKYKTSWCDKANFGSI